MTRYFLLDRNFDELHVREEMDTEAAARLKATYDDVFTDDQLRSDPALAIAFERWDRGERLPLVRAHARSVLTTLISGALTRDGALHEAFSLADSYNEDDDFSSHAAADEACRIVADFLEGFDRIAIRARALDLRTEDIGLGGRWSDLEGAITLDMLTDEERWDSWAADHGRESAERVLGPRESFRRGERPMSLPSTQRFTVTDAAARELFGDRLRRTREGRDLTIEDLARLGGTTPEWITLMETGRSEDTPSTVIGDICRTLGVSFDWLLGRSDDPSGAVSR